MLLYRWCVDSSIGLIIRPVNQFLKETSKNVRYRLRGPALVVEKDIHDNSKQPQKKLWGFTMALV
jgi:hypothetical protein